MMAQFKNPPWEVADGIVICEGGSETGPGKILFVLRGAMGTREVYTHELLSEYGEIIVRSVNSHAALVNVLERLLKTIDSGTWRDRAELSIAAHPAVDDARGILAAVGTGSKT